MNTYVTTWIWFLDIGQVAPEGQHPEKGTQDIFSCGNPGHRFDMQRVYGKQHGHDGAMKRLLGQLYEYGEYKQGVDNV